MSHATAHPAWCCQRCGAPIGYLGRAMGRVLGWIGVTLHRCNRNGQNQDLQGLQAAEARERVPEAVPARLKGPVLRPVRPGEHEAVLVEPRGGGRLEQGEGGGVMDGPNSTTDLVAAIEQLKAAFVAAGLQPPVAVLVRPGELRNLDWHVSNSHSAFLAPRTDGGTDTAISGVAIREDITSLTAPTLSPEEVAEFQRLFRSASPGPLTLLAPDPAPTLDAAGWEKIGDGQWRLRPPDAKIVQRARELCAEQAKIDPDQMGGVWDGGRLPPNVPAWTQWYAEARGEVELERLRAQLGHPAS